MIHRHRWVEVDTTDFADVKHKGLYLCDDCGIQFDERQDTSSYGGTKEVERLRSYLEPTTEERVP